MSHFLLVSQGEQILIDRVTAERLQGQGGDEFASRACQHTAGFNTV
jgi:hypothetical protein